MNHSRVDTVHGRGPDMLSVVTVVEKVSTRSTRRCDDSVKRGRSSL